MCAMFTKVATRDINLGILIKNTPESRSRPTLDITMNIENKLEFIFLCPKGQFGR